MAAVAAAAALVAVAGTQVAQGVQKKRFLSDEADTQKELGRIEASRVRKEKRRLLGKQRAQFAASGVDVGQGTPLNVLAETTREMELEAMRRNALFKNRARNLDFAGDQAMISGIASGVSTLLSGAGAGGTFSQAFQGFGSQTVTGSAAKAAGPNISKKSNLFPSGGVRF